MQKNIPLTGAQALKIFVKLLVIVLLLSYFTLHITSFFNMNYNSNHNGANETLRFSIISLFFDTVEQDKI